MAFDWERHLRKVDNDEATGETLAAIDHALIELARLRESIPVADLHRALANEPGATRIRVLSALGLDGGES